MERELRRDTTRITFVDTYDDALSSQVISGGVLFRIDFGFWCRRFANFQTAFEEWPISSKLGLFGKVDITNSLYNERSKEKNGTTSIVGKDSHRSNVFWIEWNERNLSSLGKIFLLLSSRDELTQYNGRILDFMAWLGIYSPIYGSGTSSSSPSDVSSEGAPPAGADEPKVS